MKTLKIRMNLHYLPSSSVLADIEEAENVGTGTPTVFFNMNKNDLFITGDSMTVVTT